MSDDVDPTNSMVDPMIDHDELVTWTREWGLLLRSARQVAGLSLAGLGERTGLSRGYLSKLEASQDGARNPSRATLAALARALPSFKPMAYQLGPGGPSRAVSVALAESLPTSSLLAAEPGETVLTTDDENVPRPIQLGWREFEALVAFLALERSAAPVPLSARLIARAADRTLADMRRTLAALVERGALQSLAPGRPGADPTYGRGEILDTQLGLSRVGDALILAAALFTQASAERAKRSDAARVQVQDDER